MDVDTGAVEASVRRHLGETLAAVTDQADRVVTTWNGQEATDSDAITAELRPRLEDYEDELLALLETAVDAAEKSLVTDPVPAPPYLTVTSRGPVLRGPVADGRLVVVVPVFRVTGEGQYVRTAAEKPLTIEWYPDERSRS